MAAPAFVAAYQSVFNTATSPKSVTASVQAGDIIVVGLMSESETVNPSSPVATGNTFTLRQSVDISGYSSAYLWTAVAAATNASLGISVATSVVGQDYGIVVLIFRSSDGVGASSKTNIASGAPSLGLTTTQADSAIVVISTDWNATDGSSRIWRTGAGALSEQLYYRDPARYTVYSGYHANSGAVGAKTVGLSAPSGQKYATIAVEIKGSAGGAEEHIGSLALSGSGSLSLVGTPAVPAAIGFSGDGVLVASDQQVAIPVELALSGDGTLGLSGTPIYPAEPFDGSGEGSLTLSGQPGMSGALSGTGEGALSVSGTPSITGSVALFGTGVLAGEGTPEVQGAVSLSGAGTLSLFGGIPTASGHRDRVWTGSSWDTNLRDDLVWSGSGWL